MEQVMTDAPTFGQRVRARRLELGLSQTKLAARARLKQPRISQFERDLGDGPVPVRTLHDLADALGDLIAGDPLHVLAKMGYDCEPSRVPRPVLRTRCPASP